MPPETRDPPPSLSESEVQVAAQLLGASLEPEEARIRAGGFARSTYQESKRRLYARGWLRDRYIPAPEAVGSHRVAFLLCRPFAERLSSSVARLEQLPEVVHLWVSEETVFSVLFQREADVADSFAREVSSGAFGGDAVLLEVDPRAPTVPVYFDFEGMWCRWTATPGPARYPRSLPWVDPRLARGRAGAMPPRAALSDLLARPFAEESGERPAHLLGPRTLPRSQRKILESGWVEWRVLPDLGKLPAYREMRPSHIVLARGDLRSGTRLLELYQALVAELHAFPFLLACDQRHVLVGAVALSALEPPTSTGAPASSAPSLLDVLGPRLEGIEVTRLPTSGLRSPVFHRYHRLLSG